MARLFPERLPSSTPDSEKRVWEALARDLDERYAVFHSVTWHSQGFKPDGEADFLIAHPELGLLVLEVKGGGIEFDARTSAWTSTDRYGVVNSIKDPFRQALAAKHELAGDLKKDARWPPGRRVQIGYGVVFPDIDLSQRALADRLPRDLVLDRRDLIAAGETVPKLLSHWRIADASDPPGSDGIRAVTERYGSSWSCPIPLRDAIAPDERRIVELTEQQFDVLAILGRQRKAAIGGCAGSGKSLLAIAKAAELAESGKRVLLTCFNKSLAGSWSGTLALPEGVVVRHFHGLAHDLVTRAGLEPPPGLSGQPYSTWLETNLLAALAAKPEWFDAVIVDEGQDFLPEWMEALDLLLDSDSGIFYLFYDDNQRLYRSTEIPPWLGRPYSLTRNVRNTDEIGRLVKQFYDGQMRLSGVTGSPVKVILEPRASDSEPSAVTGVRAALDQLRRRGADPSDIVVLTGHRFDPFLAHRRMGPWTLRTRDESKGDVLIETIHSFKGQDRSVVILADIGSLPAAAEQGDPLAESLLYVGFSRARSLLVVVLPEAAMAPIERRIARSPTPRRTEHDPQNSVAARTLATTHVGGLPHQRQTERGPTPQPA